MLSIKAFIIDEFLSKLNLQFPNNKILIKPSSLTLKMLSSIISAVFKRVLHMLVYSGGSAEKNVLLIPLQGCKNVKD